MPWPILVAALILAVAVIMYQMFPTVFDFGNHFLWGVAAFFILYIIAAAYMMYVIPNVSEIEKRGSPIEITVDMQNGSP